MHYVVGLLYKIIFLITLIGIRSWYQDFLYRKTITFTNSGSNQVNYEVEYYFDSSVLQAGEKIRNDCFDIEFTDSSDSKLNFWLEQGCGLSRTTYWLKIPDFPNGNTTIWMYYGANSGSNPGLEWTQRFGFMKSVACNGVYTHMTEMQSMFALGSTFEDLGTTYGSDTHSHSTNGRSYDTSWVAGPAGICDGILSLDHGGGVFCPNHAHTMTMGGVSSTTTHTSLPFYRNYVFCRGTSAHSTTFPLIPTGSLAMFEHTTPITNWGDAGEVNSANLWIRGSDAGSVDTSVYTGDHPHNLDITGATFSIIGTTCTDIYESGTSDTWFAVDNHQHTTGWPACTTNGKQNVPPYLFLNVRKATTDTHFVSGMITFQFCAGACSRPPLGWDRYTTLDTVFPRGATSSLLTKDTAPTHFHTFTDCVTGVDPDSHFQMNSWVYGVCGSGHQHTVTGNVDAAGVLPNHRYMYYIQRKTPVSTAFVDGSTIYFYTCYGIVNGSAGICSDHGDCTGFNVCKCDHGYTGQSCEYLSYNHFEYIRGDIEGRMFGGNYSSNNNNQPRPGGRSRMGGGMFGSYGAEFLVLFGGFGVAEEDFVVGRLADLWKYDCQSRLWSYIKGKTTLNSYSNEFGVAQPSVYDTDHLPGARSSYAFFSSAFSFFVFGGMVSGSASSFSTIIDPLLEAAVNDTDELWELSVLSLDWRRLEKPEVLIKNNSSLLFGTPTFRKRSSHCAAKLFRIQNGMLDPVFIFGGGAFDEMSHDSVVLNDLWTYDIHNNELSPVRLDNRTFVVYDPSYNVTTSYFGDNNHNNETNNYNFYQKYNESVDPSPRFDHICWVGLNHHFFVFGGTTPNFVDSTNDVWMFNTTRSSWVWVSGTVSPLFDNRVASGLLNNYDVSNLPSSRSSSILFINQDVWSSSQFFDSEFMFFGGVNRRTHYVFADVWSFSSQSWEFKFVNGSLLQDQTGSMYFIGSRYAGIGGRLMSSNKYLIVGGLF